MNPITAPEQLIQKNKMLLFIASAFFVLSLILRQGISLPTLPTNPFASNATSFDNTGKVVTQEAVNISTVKKSGPSVVTIVGTLPGQSQYDFSPFTQSQQPQEDKIVASGFIVSSGGLIVTNKHVVSDPNAFYKVITASDKTYDVQNIYRDPQNDIAILKVNPSQNGESLQAVNLGDSSHLEVGSNVIAIGTALGEFRNSVTTGIISGLGRGIEAGDIYKGELQDLSGLIQTSAAINLGNSGGPLINNANQVIGINTAIAAEGQGIGFAIPINAVKKTLNSYNFTKIGL